MIANLTWTEWNELCAAAAYWDTVLEDDRNASARRTLTRALRKARQLAPEGPT